LLRGFSHRTLTRNFVNTIPVGSRGR